MSEPRYLPPILTAPTVDILLDGPSEPWERQPRETDVAWQLFQAYRESAYPEGPGGGFLPRDVRTFARALGYDSEQIRRIALSHDWTNRAALFDRTIDRKRTEENLASLPEVLATHKKILGITRRLVLCELRKWLEKAESDPSITLKPAVLKSLLEVGIKLDRLTYGESTEHVKIEGAWDLTNLNLDQLNSLREIMKTAEVEAEEPVH